MPFLTDGIVPGKSASRKVLDKVKVWNRKGHYYFGLYLLFFLWLFAFTGLLLNHGQWSFAEFWPSRKISRLERAVEIRPAAIDLERARDLMRQLGIRGEIEWTAATANSDRFEFRVNRPGHNFAVTLDPDHRRAIVEHTQINGWGVLHVLHTFTGVRAGDTRNQRDWILTRVWALAMDAVAIGLIVLVLTGLYLWWGLAGAKRKLGACALALGTTTCALFVIGLRWLYS